MAVTRLTLGSRPERALTAYAANLLADCNAVFPPLALYAADKRSRNVATSALPRVLRFQQKRTDATRQHHKSLIEENLVRDGFILPQRG
jgi:hypothetical protein